MENRPALQKLLADARKGRFQQVIVWKINRVSRKQLDLLKIVDELKQNGVTFRSYSENFETETPMGQFALQMMGAVGELERNQIVDNVKMGMKQRAREGKWNGGVVLGYDVVEVEDSKHRRRRETELVINPEEAQLIQKIFNYYADGKGLKAITNELNGVGYRSKHGRPFSVNTIKTILSNPLYTGKIRFNKQEDWNTKRRKGTNPNPILVKGIHEAIISEELYDKVQSMYGKRNYYHHRVFFGSFPFTGILRCPVCGHGMVSQRATRKRANGERYYTLYYQCVQFANKGSSVCRANSIRADYAEAEILRRIQEFVDDPKLIEDVTRAAQGRECLGENASEDDLKQIEKGLAEVARKKAKYFELYEEDMLDKRLFKERIEELAEQEKALVRRKEAIEDVAERQEAGSVDIAYVRGMLGEFTRLWDQMSNTRKKQLAHMLIKEVIISKHKQIERIHLLV
ncbi:recombinase family protein [Saccharibacillus brassicae]|uniref:Recombinase family protein n=2 Tax=Saccharibacillus brassicae TaxID=2583377 RepID=A0A4Y6UVS3_SACBS|nr:recombinase family protein [Saccharibacillus brassicae]